MGTEGSTITETTSHTPKPEIVLQEPKEQEKTTDPKRQLLEALSPPEEDKKLIIESIKRVTTEELGQPPDPEALKVIEIASGIYLWQNMMYDTGESLPLGLVFDQNPKYIQAKNWWDDIALDKTIITLQDYDYVMGIFKKHEIDKAVAEIHQRQRETHRAEIANGVEEILKHSRVMDYFDAFTITTEEESNEVPIERGSLQWQTEKNKLDEMFLERYGALPNAKGDPMLGRLYEQQVLIPLRRLKTPGDRETADERQKSKFRSYIQESYFARSGLVPDEKTRQAVIVKDGKFLFPQKGQDGKITYITDEERYAGKNEINWGQFILREVAKSGPYLGLYSDYANQYEFDTFDYTIPRLYDQNDPRSFEAIVAEGIHQTAEKIADQIVKEKMLNLNQNRGVYFYNDKRSIYDEARYQLVRLVWLTGVKRSPTLNREQEDIGFPLYDREKLEIQGHENKEPKRLGEVIFANPEVYQEASERVLVATLKNNGLQQIPVQADLCVRFNPDTKLKLNEWGKIKEVAIAEYDPVITGMRLVGKMDDKYYFSLENVGSTYGKTFLSTSHLRTIEIASFCRDIGMNDLAEAIKRENTRDLDKLIEIAQQHIIEDVPEENKTIQLDNPRSLAEQGLIDTSGKLHADDQVAEYFIRSILKIAGVEGRKLVGDSFSTAGIIIDNIAHTLLYQSSKSSNIIDPLHAAREGARKFTKNEKNKPDEYPDKPTTIHTPGKQEREEKAHTKVAEIRYLDQRVFKNGERRLIQQRKRNLELPNVPPGKADLVMETVDDRFEYQDPYVSGMTLIARNNDICYFKLDQSKTSYRPPRNELASENLKRNKMKAIDDEESHDTIGTPKRDGRKNVGPKERGNKNESSVHIPNAEDFDKEKNNHIGEVLFVNDEIFIGASQRLIQRTARDESVSNIITRKQKIIVTEQADVAIQVTSNDLVNEQEDLVILGMKLIGRDDKNRVYYFELDRENDVYARLEEPIPPHKQQAEADFCEKIGMGGLAQDIRTAENLTVAGLLDLDRKYVKAWVSKDAQQNFVLKDRQGFATKGLIDENGVLRGVCDSFEFFISEQMGNIFGQQSINTEAGFSLNESKHIDVMTHAQTRIRLKDKGIDRILDVEPDPAKAEIERGSTTDLERNLQRTKSMQAQTTEEKADQRSGDDETKDETKDVERTEKSASGEPQGKEPTVKTEINSPEKELEEVTLQSETVQQLSPPEYQAIEQLKEELKKPTEENKSLISLPIIRDIARGLTKLSSKKEDQQSEAQTEATIGDIQKAIRQRKAASRGVNRWQIPLKRESQREFILPTPDDLLKELTIDTYDWNARKQIMLKGEAARAYLYKKQDEEDARFDVEEGLASSCFLFERYFLTYLNIPIVNQSFDTKERQIYHALRDKIEAGKEVWTNIPDIVVYSLVREYLQKAQNEYYRYYGDFTIEEQRLELAKELLQAYRDNPQQKRPLHNGRRLPPYDPRFLRIMENVVEVFDQKQKLQTSTA